MFEKFRSSSLKRYGSRPSHYLRVPALSRDAMLSMTKVELEIASNTGLYLFFEKSTRNGFSYISKRYSKANNKYLKSYDLKQESKYIKYLYQNNLYGYVMSKLLPIDGFKRTYHKTSESTKSAIDSSKGCVLEVDLIYPKELHQFHNDYHILEFNQSQW